VSGSRTAYHRSPEYNAGYGQARADAVRLIEEAAVYVLGSMPAETEEQTKALKARHTALIWTRALVKALRNTPTELIAQPLSAWHEDVGSVLWWRFPINEPPYAGSPLDSDWPGYHTHWTSIVVPDRSAE